MNVDWNWIKQRPHFLALGLSHDYDVCVMYPISLHRSRLQEHNDTGNIKRCIPFFVFPFESKLKISELINNIIQRILFSITIYFFKPDYIWFCYPRFFYKVPKQNTKVIYDCMDNHYDMLPTDKLKRIISLHEKRLVTSADLIFTSSDALKGRILSCFIKKQNTQVQTIHNAFSGEIINIEYAVNSGIRLKIAYIGTVSNWFDNDLIEKSLDNNSEIEYFIIGPAEIRYKKIKNTRVHYLGQIEHADLYDTIRDYDCLVMPFIINNIIKYVDPVKLYEYVNFNKNIICPYYDEIKKFKKFIYCYSSYSEYYAILKHLAHDNKLKYSKETRFAFLKENSWTTRIAEAQNFLHCL